LSKVDVENLREILLHVKQSEEELWEPIVELIAKLLNILNNK
jgi:hypothetical protein